MNGRSRLRGYAESWRSYRLRPGSLTRPWIPGVGSADQSATYATEPPVEGGSVHIFSTSKESSQGTAWTPKLQRSPLQTARSRYEEYINSDAWSERRAAFFEHHPRRCRSCGTGKQIHLHHTTYQRLGREEDEDLVPLCEHHHRVVHRLHAARRSQLSLRQVTAMVIAKPELDAPKRPAPKKQHVKSKPKPKAVQPPQSKKTRSRKKWDKRVATAKGLGPSAPRPGLVVAGTRKAVLPKY